MLSKPLVAIKLRLFWYIRYTCKGQILRSYLHCLSHALNERHEWGSLYIFPVNATIETVKTDLKLFPFGNSFIFGESELLISRNKTNVHSFFMCLQTRNYCFAKMIKALLISQVLNGLISEVCKTAPYAERLQEDTEKKWFFFFPLMS